MTVNVVRPSINIAPLSNKQVEEYLAAETEKKARVAREAAK